MAWYIALLLGIVQGLTEFLPVSSSGHLVLINRIFKINTDFVLLSVILHLATLFAVVFVFRKEIWQLVKSPFSSYALKLYAATVPTVIIVLILKSFVESSFGGAYLPICFAITAAILLLTNFFAKEKNIPAADFKTEITYRNAVFMGIAQGLAIFPGVSRSGSTICTGLIAGEKRSEVAKFSFLMSIPIILASMIFELISSDISTFATTEMAVGTSVAFIAAFIVGIFSIKFMLKIVQKAKYWWFSVYLMALSIVCLFV